MLFLYFFRNFYKFFFIYFFSLVGIFGVSDLLLRLDRLPALSFLPAVFICMIPLVMQFALPIASGLAVQTTLGALYASNALLMVSFFSLGRRALLIATGFFSLSLLGFYTPLIMQWAPKSYDHGKKIMVAFAREHIESLAPETFHYPAPNVMLYFKEKKFDTDNVVIFSHLIIMIVEQGKSRKKQLTIPITERSIMTIFRLSM